MDIRNKLFQPKENLIWKGLDFEINKYRNSICGDLSMSLTTATTAYTPPLPKKKRQNREEIHCHYIL